MPDDLRAGTVTTFPEGSASLTLAFGSCARTNSDGAVFDAIRDVDPDLYVIMGDIHYRNIEQNDPSLFAAAYSQVHDSPGQSFSTAASRSPTHGTTTTSVRTTPIRAL